MAHLAGKSGDVYVAPQLLSDCETAWDVTDGATATSAAVDTDAKVGTYSVKIVCAIGVAVGDLLAHSTISSTDLATAAYTHLMYWAKCTDTTTAAGDITIGVSETDHMGGTPVYTNVPILTAATWKYCFTTLTTTGLDAVISIGAKLIANDPGAFDLQLDDIRAAKLIAGINSWSLDYTSDAIESTDFGSAGVKAYIVGGSGWAGSFAGYKEGIPLSIGEIYGVSLAESSTATEMWLGNAIITGVHPSVGHDGIVSYSYDYQGTGNLTVAST